MKVTIDGQAIEVEPGTTILQAARMIGGESVPPQCAITKLKEWWKMPLLQLSS
jgi:NADH-quinone oxidoreductase subunit G